MNQFNAIRDSVKDWMDETKRNSWESGVSANCRLVHSSHEAHRLADGGRYRHCNWLNLPIRVRAIHFSHTPFFSSIRPPYYASRERRGKSWKQKQSPIVPREPAFPLHVSGTNDGRLMLILWRLLPQLFRKVCLRIPSKCNAFSADRPVEPPC